MKTWNLSATPREGAGSSRGNAVWPRTMSVRSLSENVCNSTGILKYLLLNDSEEAPFWGIFPLFFDGSLLLALFIVPLLGVVIGVVPSGVEAFEIAPFAFCSLEPLSPPPPPLAALVGLAPLESESGRLRMDARKEQAKSALSPKSFFRYFVSCHNYHPCTGSYGKVVHKDEPRYLRNVF